MHKKMNTAIALVATSVALACGAQTIRPAYDFPSAPTGGVELGTSGVFATPYFGIGWGHDDNLFLSRDNPRTSNLTTASPGLRLDARTANSLFQLAYQSQIGRYSDSSQDDYVDHTTRMQYDVALDRRTFLRLGLDYLRLHDPRGSTDRPFSNSPDKYQLIVPSGTFAFGTPGAQGRIELYASDQRKMYMNNRDFTAVSDRDVPEYGGAFYWRVAPKTSLVAEAREDLVRYDIASPFSAKEHRYFVGASWEATAFTSGTLKVGRLTRDFDSALPSVSSTVWEGAITWAPLSYSRFDLLLDRTTNESTGLGNFILSSVAAVTWRHAWSSYLDTSVLARYQKDEYQGFDRTDDTKSIGFKVGYRFRPWLTLGAEFTHFRRDSNIGIFEYDRNLYLLTATSSL